MAKERKSKVNKLFPSERELPTPEETTKAVEEATGQPETKRKPGRPPAEHDRVRFTTLITPELRAKIKIIAAREDEQIHNVFNLAVRQYVEAWEKQNGKIDL